MILSVFDRWDTKGLDKWDYNGLDSVRQVTWDSSLGRRCAHLFYRAAGAVLDSLPAGHLGSNTLELYASISCPALKGQLKQKAHIRIFKGTVTQITKR